MKKLCLAIFVFAGTIFISCKESSSKDNQTKQETNSENPKGGSVYGLTIYKTNDLIIKKLTNHTYVHISFLDTDDYGKVACNGMLVVNENEGIVFDTPTNNKNSLELINFVVNELKSEIIALVPTHFHEDCVGGIRKFEEQDIPTYASKQTVALLNENNLSFSKPIEEFEDGLTLDLGGKKVHVEYYGEGHTIDNVIGYFPEDKAVFGGCLIKEVGASKGYLGDANTSQWSKTVRKIKLKYPKMEIVIPGHGKWGGNELFDYTMEMFE